MPVGFKNSTDGSIKAAADSCFAAGFEHHFLSINLDGRVISAETKGNPDCHLVLRGSSHGPNYDAESVRQALEDLKVSKASGPSQHGLVIDAAHGNCGKDENREAEVIEEIAERLAHGEQGITGVMMESFLVGGHQKPAPLDQLVYGQSVTDSCVPWERTNELLHTLADAVTARRSAQSLLSLTISLGTHSVTFLPITVVMSVCSRDTLSLGRILTQGEMLCSSRRKQRIRCIRCKSVRSR